MLLLSMTSCNKHKDGVFNPKQKISAIYYSYRSQSSWYNSDNYTWEDYDPYITPLYKQQEWIWDGKQLQQIKHFSSDGTLNYIETFTYGKKKLSRIDCKYTDGDTYYSTFEYDGKGKELLRANCHESSGAIYCKVEYTHTDKKISDVEITYYDYDKKSMSSNKGRHIATMRMVMPMGQIPNRLIEIQENKINAKDAYAEKTKYSFTWTDNNITRIIVTEIEDGGNDTDIYNLTYDNKKNPFYGFLDGEDALLLEGGNFCENNILGWDNDAPYVYEYDQNDYPTSCVYTYTYNSDTYRDRSTTTHNYEYLK